MHRLFKNFWKNFWEPESLPDAESQPKKTKKEQISLEDYNEKKQRHPLICCRFTLKFAAECKV